MKWHLVQVKFGVPRGAYEDPAMAGFVDKLESINALANTASQLANAVND